jgi:putative transposase
LSQIIRGVSFSEFKYGKWFLIYAEPIELPQPKQSGRAIALDPGVRTFQTGFDGERFLEFGSGDIGRIYRLCGWVDRLVSKRALSLGKPLKRYRYKLGKAIARIRVRIQNLIREVHNQAAAELTKFYSFIFLPGFETQQMVRKATRRIRSKTARAMMTWSHYQFKQTLKHHAAKRGCVVVDVTEEYTSKTCPVCGHVHSKLGGSKKYVCPECGYTQGRDKNGAFNILLKALGDTPASHELVSYIDDSGFSGNV